MKRLTKKEKNRLSTHSYYECDYLLNGTPRIKALNKLGKLEDIEEELGIDLITFFKAFENGIYVKDYYNAFTKNNYCGDLHFWYCQAQQSFFSLEPGEETVDLADYGKTWALTKEELQNDK